MIRSLASFAVVVTTLVSTIGAGEALAAGDAGRGRKVTEKWCALCHAVSGARKPTAPAFSSIVRRAGRDDAYLRDFLEDDHFPMTMHRLFEHEKEDVLEYFRLLRTRR